MQIKSIALDRDSSHWMLISRTLNLEQMRQTARTVEKSISESRLAEALHLHCLRSYPFAKLNSPNKIDSVKYVNLSNKLSFCLLARVHFCCLCHVFRFEGMYTYVHSTCIKLNFLTDHLYLAYFGMWHLNSEYLGPNQLWLKIYPQTLIYIWEVKISKTRTTFILNISFWAVCKGNFEVQHTWHRVS